MRKYRFYFHYHRHGEKQMTIKYKGRTIQVDDILCLAPCDTKWNKKQPLLVMQGFATDVKIVYNKKTRYSLAVIEDE